ncbi:hypothetical protein GN244_ATG05042 [Phytophthora infestans]|uniref:Uncharacterized protein n=1 Tax=Phytophthora infestans TaxID=4787 RepID=A0A833SLK1_PHYIN|nr:hypothetical protein GN244_ATG05042 [Phytophthora infestans]
MTDNVNSLAVTLSLSATIPAETTFSASSSDFAQAQYNLSEGRSRSTGCDDEGLLCLDAVDELLTIPVVERPSVNIEPPPEKTCASVAEAISPIHQWAKDHGFNFGSVDWIATEQGSPNVRNTLLMRSENDQ